MYKLNCNKCKAKGHVAKVCKFKKTQANVIDDDGDSKTEEAALSFELWSFSKVNMVAHLSHRGMNEIGRWARIKVEDHPEVFVYMEVDKLG